MTFERKKHSEENESMRDDEMAESEEAEDGEEKEEAPEPNSPYYPDFGINAGLVEEIHDRYQVDPDSVDSSWGREFGPGSQPAAAPGPTSHHAPQSQPQPSATSPERPAPQAGPASAAATLATNSVATPATHPTASRTPSPTVAPTEPLALTSTPQLLQLADKHARVLRLIHFYRARGHRIASSDPLGGQASYFPELDPAHYGLGHEDLDVPFTVGDLAGGSVQTLRQILDRLKTTYCGSMGAEYTHVQDPGRKAWLRELMEKMLNVPRLGDPDRHRILEMLTGAEHFERFLHTKFLGQKRFSLEGAETIIPMLDAVVESAPKYGIREIVFGMSHRGRLLNSRTTPTPTRPSARGT